MATMTTTFEGFNKHRRNSCANKVVVFILWNTYISVTALQCFNKDFRILLLKSAVGP